MTEPSLPHAEKHELEQTAVRAALAAHEKLHEVADRAHANQHDADARAVKLALDTSDRRLSELNQLRAEVVSDRSQFVLAPTHAADLKALETRVNTVEKLLDKAEGSLNTWRFIAGFLGISGVAAVFYAILNAGP